MKKKVLVLLAGIAVGSPGHGGGNPARDTNGPRLQLRLPAFLRGGARFLRENGFTGQKQVQPLHWRICKARLRLQLAEPGCQRFFSRLRAGRRPARSAPRRIKRTSRNLPPRISILVEGGRTDLPRRQDECLDRGRFSWLII